MGKYYEYLYTENLTKNLPVEIKIEAIKELGRMKSTAAVPLLKAMLLDNRYNTYVKHLIILSLTEIGDKTFFSSFVPFIDVTDEDLLESIIIAVGKLKAEEYISELEKFINHDNVDIKKEVLFSLSLIDNESSVQTMIKYYNDKDVELRQFVKAMLKDSNEFQKYVDKINDIETLNLITIVPESRAELLIDKMISTSNDIKVLKLLIHAIGELKFKKAISYIIEIYEKFDNSEIKIKALEALERVDSIEKKDFLIQKIESEKDRNIRVKILFAMGNITKYSDVAGLILKIAKDKNEWWMTRKVAIMIIGVLPDKSYCDGLAELLNTEEDTRVVRTIIKELGDTGNEKYTKYIDKYLKTEEEELKKITILSLSKLGDKNILENLVNDEALRERLMPESLKAIMNFDDTRVADILVDIIDKNRVELFDVILEGFAEVRDEKIKKRLIKIIMDKDARREHRAKSLMLLASYNDSDTEEVLKYILDTLIEWWMIKKLAIVIAGELKMYSLIHRVLRYSTELDSRIAKSAKEVSRQFYEEYFMPRLKEKDESLYRIAEGYLPFLE